MQCRYLVDTIMDGMNTPVRYETSDLLVCIVLAQVCVANCKCTTVYDTITGRVVFRKLRGRPTEINELGVEIHP